MRIRTGKLRVSVQNGFYTQPGIHVPGDVCVISGTYLYDLGTPPTLQTTWDGFTTKTQAEVETRLREVFLPSALGVRTDTRGVIILDIETAGTVGIEGHFSHPNHLWEEIDSDKALIITAWKRRIAAVKAVFPNARVGMYALPRSGNLGDGGINAGDGHWPDRIGALVQAGTATGYNGVGGAYDDLDLLIPICYQIWGPSDSEVEWSSNRARVVECMDGAAQIKKSNGSNIPAMPFLSTCVFGAASADDGVAILDLAHPDPLAAVWDVAFDVFRDYGIEEVCVWNGLNSRYAVNGSSPIGPSTHLLASMIHPNKTSVPYLSTVGATAASQGSVTPGLPDGGRLGDVELLLVETANEVITLTSAQNFVEVANSPQGTGTGGSAGSVRLGVYWRAWSASNGAPVIADSGNHTFAAVLLFRNCSAVAAPTVTAGDTAASSTSVSIPGLTTTVDRSLIVAICADAIDNPNPRTSGVANASLSAVAKNLDKGTAQAVGGGITVVTGLKATTGTVSATTGTLSSASAQARICLALRPAA